MFFMNFNKKILLKKSPVNLLNIYFSPRLIKGMDSCFPTA